MVAFPPFRPATRPRRKLTAILSKALDDLRALESEVRAVSAGSGKKGELSASALRALQRFAREGAARIQSRLTAMGAEPVGPGTEAAPRADAASPSIAPGGQLHGFITAYRRCGRRLCLAQAEARAASDGTTADLVFHLLRDLERQLWLLDASGGAMPLESITSPAIFQFC